MINWLILSNNKDFAILIDHVSEKAPLSGYIDHDYSLDANGYKIVLSDSKTKHTIKLRNDINTMPEIPFINDILIIEVDKDGNRARHYMVNNHVID